MLTIVAIALGTAIVKLAATAAETMCEAHKRQELAAAGKTISSVEFIHVSEKNVLKDLNRAMAGLVSVVSQDPNDIEKIKKASIAHASETYEFLNGVIVDGRT